ncbi:hypothetical protein SAMN05421640_2960 [Ekhidna lutea]|uniref:Uncharacterized protein n=1 Tax=Ekhidna lutea TaxID=447679 RepID=A0A239L429_EKHLU|nr:hypothetical protein [Ekhidna lutea]SNT25201.1 hypothetical protein SAMN05421640_2960 [Ekhidna lutea]
MLQKVLLLSVFISFSSITVGQKIKYKDVYPYLVEKNYVIGIPQLKKFLSISGNENEANPNLQMGIWLHERYINAKSANSTPSKELSDSAVFYLEKARGLIDEKELKKNKQYYQDFVRRDLRSGKFLIKVSDVHLDIENKIAAIKQED